MNNQLLFTPSAVLDMLIQIDELKNVDIGISETLDGKLQLTVGESEYIIEPSDLQTTLNINDTDLENIEQLSEDTYQELASDGQIELDPSEPVESGIIKELAKTLLVGGLVRLAGKKFSDLIRK